MSLINQNIGWFPVGEGYIHPGDIYPAHSGMTSLEVYCYGTGFTLPNGDIPQTGICWVINNGLVPYNISQSDNPQNINMNGFKVTNMGTGTDPDDGATVSFVQNLFENGVDLSEVGQPDDLLIVSENGSSLEGINKEDVTPKFVILEALLSL